MAMNTISVKSEGMMFSEASQTTASGYDLAQPHHVSKWQTLLELVDERASVSPDVLAYAGLSSDLQIVEQISYGELQQRAKEIANVLIQERDRVQPKQAQKSERLCALMLYPSGIDFVTAFFGCLYAGVLAVPAYPPQSQQLTKALSRLQSISQDAGAHLILTTQKTTNQARQVLKSAFPSTEDTENQAKQASHENRSSSDCLQYPLMGPNDERLSHISALPWLATDHIGKDKSVTARTPADKFENESSQGVGSQSATGTNSLQAGIDPLSTQIAGDTVAYLQYTSGSTGQPNGVMVTHGNLLQDLELIAAGGRVAPNDYPVDDADDELGGMVSWLPIFHDMGLIYGMLLPLYEHMPCYMMSPIDFMKQPMRWVKAISKYRATHTAAPNFAYALCVRKFKPDAAESLDLSRWRIAVNAAEPIRSDTLYDFCQTFGPYGFSPNQFMAGYGLAEATLKVTSTVGQIAPTIIQVDSQALQEHRVEVIDSALLNPISASEDTGHQAAIESNTPISQPIVGCGCPQNGTQVRIVNPESRCRCNQNEVGEIWLSGPHVAKGYWHNSEKSRSIFDAHIADTTEGPFLRTGDLGFLYNNELFICGRSKELLIIRGRNHYPQDLEHTAQADHPVLRSGCGAAFSVTVKGAERVVLVQEIKPDTAADTELDELWPSIRSAISTQHEISLSVLCLLPPGSIPKTSSGKIQRNTCKNLWLKKKFQPVKEWSMFDDAKIEPTIDITDTPVNTSDNGNDAMQSITDLKHQIREEVATILMVEGEEVSANIALEDLGLDSQESLELIGAIEGWVGRQLPESLVAEHKTIEAIAKHVVASKDEYPATAESDGSSTLNL